MATWRDVDWSQTLAGNDREGDCGPVSLANLMDILLYPQVVGRTEVERFYTVATGWTSENPESDKGAILEVLIQDWIANGWPADPLLKPSGYEVFRPKDIVAALAEYQACPTALALPEGQDFTDAALGLPGVYGHAVLVVDASDVEVRFATWGRIVTVSWAWWMEFAREVYGVALTVPTVA